MKHERHNAIRELVAAAPISNQDELRRKLVGQGFDVTQATLSRDFRELHLSVAVVIQEQAISIQPRRRHIKLRRGGDGGW